MADPALFEVKETEITFELIYDADMSLMRAKDLSDAISGFSTCLSIAGRSFKIDFDDVYVSPLEQGSLKAVFRFVKRHKTAIIVGTISGTTSGLMTAAIIGSFNAIGQFGTHAYKNPSGDAIKIDKKALELCLSTPYRAGVSKVAKPINEVNQKVTIKVNGEGYEIDCNNQYKFIDEEQEPVLPNLQNGTTVSLVGQLKSMDMIPSNTLSFIYDNKVLKLSPNDPNKSVAVEYHQYTVFPQVKVTGLVMRENLFELPRLRVVKMEEVKIEQMKLLDKEGTISAEASESAKKK